MYVNVHNLKSENIYVHHDFVKRIPTDMIAGLFSLYLPTNIGTIREARVLVLLLLLHRDNPSTVD